METTRGASHTLRIWAHTADPRISDVSAVLAILDADGTTVASGTGAPETSADWQQVEAGPVPAVSDGVYVRADVTAVAAAAGATLHVDAVEISASVPGARADSPRTAARHCNTHGDRHARPRRRPPSRRRSPLPRW